MNLSNLVLSIGSRRTDLICYGATAGQDTPATTNDYESSHEWSREHHADSCDRREEFWDESIGLHRIVWGNTGGTHSTLGLGHRHCCSTESPDFVPRHLHAGRI